MEIFTDLLTTLSVVLPIFGFILIASILIVCLLLWLWDRRKPETDHGPLADWYESYSPPAEAKQRMETLQRPASAASVNYLALLLDKYQFYVDSSIKGDQSVLVDTKWPGLTNNVYYLKDEEVLSWGSPDEVAAVLKHARILVNRRAVKAGIKPKGPARPNRQKPLIAA